MAGVGFVVWVGYLCLALIGLAIGLYVIKNIIREARERDPAAVPTAERMDQYPETGPGRRCPNCQTVNDPSFEYCSECATKL